MIGVIDMDKENPLLPFAYTKADPRELAYSTTPRSRKVIDENAELKFHTRGSPLGPKRVPLPALVTVPRLKRKLTSYSENDYVKRPNVGELPPLLPPPLLPPIASELDVYTSQHFNFPPTLPREPEEVIAKLMPSSEADFGIDRFNRYRSLFYETPLEDSPVSQQTSSTRAREIIVESFEECCSTIDLQGLGISDIPDEIGDMEDLVVIGSLPCFQLYASNNQIRVLSPALFNFTKLNVLGLRHNKLSEIPPLIGKLNRLTDINIATNRLKWLPWQFLQLEATLQQFGLGPNPWKPVPSAAIRVDDNEGRKFIPRYYGEIEYHSPKTSVPLLKLLCLNELASFDVLYSDTKEWKRLMDPVHHAVVAKAIRAGRYQDRCLLCELILVEPMALVYEWWDILLLRNIPIRRQFCSQRCVHKYLNNRRIGL